MITITNITKKGSASPTDSYVLMINAEEIVQFEHKRQDGLAVCLLDAVAALVSRGERAATHDAG